jgi:hypothetical protein
MAIHELHQDALADGRAVLHRDREVDREPVVARPDVGAPADPGDHVALAHEEAVAEVLCRRRVVEVRARRRVVHQGEGVLVAPVVDLEEQPPVAGRHVDRLQDVHVGRELDLAGGAHGRLVDVEDLRVAGVVGVDGEMGDALQLLIGAGGAERGAVQDQLCVRDLEADEPRLCVRDRSEGKRHHAGQRQQGVLHCVSSLSGV